MAHNEFTFPSVDGINTCHAETWAPDNGEVIAVLQIVHGMIEYVGRYADFAEFMASHGFLVVGEDHLGHGHTATAEDLGYFCKEAPEDVLVENVHALKQIISDQYPDVPYYMLGHSMGSFIFRKYISLHGAEIDKAIIMGTGVMPGIVTSVGVFLTNFQKLFFGDRHVSKMIQKIAFGAYNKRIENPRTENDWLTRDVAIVDKYNADPFCTFPFTLNAYRTLFKILGYVCKKQNITTIPKTLPVFIVAGSADPVGNYGAGPATVADWYRKAGINDVTLKLYKDFRHEILNEIGHEEVYNDILEWLNRR